MFSRLACAVSYYTGRPIALTIAVIGLLIGWRVLSTDTFNLSISVVSLLLLFLIQGSQNQGDAATHAKLDEMIRASDARNEFIGIDRKPETEVEALRDK